MQSIGQTLDLSEGEIVGSSIDEGSWLSRFCLVENREHVPRSGGNVPNNTADGHFTAPLRGIVPSARNR